MKPVQECERLLDQLSLAIDNGLPETYINTLTVKISMVVSHYESKHIMRANEFTEAKMSQSKFQHLLTPAVTHLDDVMRKGGFEIRIVGGAVRDLVLGKDPKDIDMATDATPDQMIEVFDRAGISWVPTGLEHGTLTVVLDGEPIEITTLRIDSETDGRHADVEFTTDWKVDAERRDLTFNAMSMDLDGNLFDYFGGVEDLKAGKAKFVGDAGQRMEEDFLRILRFFRFQGRMPTPQWDKETLSKVAEKAEGLTGISGERVWMELTKILSGNHAEEILKMMDNTGVADAIGLPMNNLNEFTRVKQITNNYNLLAASLVDDMNQLKTLRKRWKFSNNENDMIEFIVANRDINITVENAKRLMSKPKAQPSKIRAVLHYQGKSKLANSLKRWKAPEFPVTGKDLLATGMTSGKEMGAALAAMRKRWEDSDFTLSKDQLIQQKNPA